MAEAGWNMERDEPQRYKRCHHRLADLPKIVHAANIKWWQNLVTGEPIERNRGKMFMLMASELAEGMEGVRKGLQDDKLPHRPMLEVEMADVVIRVLDLVGHDIPQDQLDVFLKKNYWRNAMPDPWKCPDDPGEALFELNSMLVMSYNCRSSKFMHFGSLAFFIYSVDCFCEKFNLDLWGAYDEKMKYNETRPDHQREACMAAGGKVW